MAVEESVLAAVRAAMRSVKVAAHHDKVYKDECIFSFATPESPGGLYVSLSTFQGFGEEFVALDHERTGNALYLHQRHHRVPLPAEELEKMSAPPEKLAIGGDSGFAVDRPKHSIEKELALVVLPGRQRVPLPCPDLPELVLQAIDAITKHESMSVRQETAAWEEERRVSRYAEGLPQLDTGRRISPDPRDWKCDETGVAENLWLNLSTGFIGSGRANWDGSGGNGAAMRHFESTGSKYPLVVKLGTITPHGADVYSYAPDEDDMVLDPHLAQHLQHWGINMMQMEKTEKTMAEMEIEMNLQHEFSKITESGAHLRPLRGPGHVGLINLGNSCYMNSVLQVLFSIPEVQRRYGGGGSATPLFRTAPQEPANDLPSQMAKVGRALVDGATDPPAPPVASMQVDGTAGGPEQTDDDKDRANSVRPAMFKALVGRGHAEFSSGRQQDALEFFQHLLELVARGEHANSERLGLGAAPPTKSAFQFTLEDRIQCMESGRVSYRSHDTVTLELPIPLEAATNKEEVEAYKEREARRTKLKEASAEAYIGQQPEGSEGGAGVSQGGAGQATAVTKQDGEDPVLPKVPFAACLEKFAAAEVMEDYMSAALGRKTTATKRTRFASMPPYLLIALKRYYVGPNWVPKKMEVAVEVPDALSLEPLRGRGPQPGEELQPEAPAAAAAAAAAAARPQPDESIVEQLVAMGFGKEGCQRAALATNNAGVEAAMEWVLQHMGDPDFNDPLPEPEPAAASAPAGSEPSEESVSMIMGMGFTPEQAKAALMACSNNVERAADWLFNHMDDLDSAVAAVQADKKSQAGGGAKAAAASRVVDGPGEYELVGFISHMGSNTACGHYVCHIRKNGRWVIFNDEKVAESEAPPRGLGYMYLFQRRQQ